MLDTVTDVACTLCGCVCDDLVLRFDGLKLVEAERACSLSRPWFDQLAIAENPSASITIEGKEVARDEALARCAEIFSTSRAPLIFGMSHSSTPGVRAAIQLAEQVGAIIDLAGSRSQLSSLLALQQGGASRCTLGEVRQRADLVIYWGADPIGTHPRHLERYSSEPASELLPHGRSDRTLVVIGAEPNATMEQADLFIPVSPDGHVEFLSGLRYVLQTGLWLECGVPRESVERLAGLMRRCRYGTIFYGPELSTEPVGHVAVASLAKLVAERNQETRFTLSSLGSTGGRAEAEQVVCRVTGFPLAVDFSRGYPRYQPGEFSANELLERGEVDACLLIGSESLLELSSQARARLSEIPLIVLDSPLSPYFFSESPSVEIERVQLMSRAIRFATAIYGIHAAGTATRMDGVALPLRVLCPTSLPTDAEILEVLCNRL